MTEQTTGEGIERGAAEDASGVPVTPTDIEASRTPPSQPNDNNTDSASDTDAGTSGAESTD